VAVGADAAGLSGRWHANVSFYDLRSQALQYFGVSLPSGGPSFLYAPGAVISNRGVTVALSANVIDRRAGDGRRSSRCGKPNRIVGAIQPHRGERYALYGQREQAATRRRYWAWPITYADTNGDGSSRETRSPTDQPGLTGLGRYPLSTQGAALTSSWRVGQRWHISATLDYRAGQTCSIRSPICDACIPYAAIAMTNNALSRQANASGRT